MKSLTESEGVIDGSVASTGLALSLDGGDVDLIRRLFVALACDHE